MRNSIELALMPGKRILIVEDEPSIADNVIYALNTDGFDPVWSQTAQEARKVLKECDVALVILDVGLPDESGFEFAKEIRIASRVPIIFATARAEEIDRILGLELGGDDYVVKPFSPRELSARVKAILRRVNGDLSQEVGGRAQTEVTEHGAFELDEMRVLIRYQEQDLELSRYEYRLLALLIKNPGRVFSREQLMDRVWEEPEMSLERTVDTHVNTLRLKLNLIDDEDPIVPHRGVGYSMREH